MLGYIIAVVATLIVSIPVTILITVTYRKKVAEAKIGSAEEKAREIIDEALKTAETKKRESMLEVKEESIRAKNELDKEGNPFIFTSCAVCVWMPKRMARNCRPRPIVE